MNDPDSLPLSPARFFMAEVRVADRGRSVAWYRESLGLRVVLDDAEGRFTLLESGPGGARVALKEAPEGRGGQGSVHLVFEVVDLDAQMARLQQQEIPFEGPTGSAEGYREIRLADPDGTPIGLFAWSERP